LLKEIPIVAMCLKDDGVKLFEKAAKATKLGCELDSYLKNHPVDPDFLGANGFGIP
jgi:hypothetical protein